MNRLLCALMMLAALLTPAFAAEAQPGNAIEVTLLPEARTAAPGASVTLAFVMRPRAGWHGYWSNPGDAGAGARLAWRLPAGMSAGPLQYPVPGRLMIAGMMNYVFERDYALLSTVRVPSEARPGARLPLVARLDYLACTDKICVPQSATVSAELRVERGAQPENRAAIDRYREALPRPLGTEARFEMRGGRLRLAVPLPASLAVEDPYFYPLSEGVIDYAAPQSISRSGDMLVIETASDGPTPAILQGVLGIGEGVGLSLTARPGPVPAAGTPLTASAAAAAGQSGLTAILAALAGAIAGGLLLNIMPCVFPILSLKALSLARLGGDEAAARREALAYTAGVVLACAALGALLLAVRAGGTAAGWAFQLQDPRVIVFLFLLVTVIALNLAGLFELPVLGGGDRLAGSGGTAGAFWTGALAAFVATPCTGPFMGAALGAALVLPDAAALAVFAGLGLGLALPFLLLGFVPGLRRALPRPGPWMARFRRILSVPMFLTALGLAWVLGRQAGAGGMLLAAAAAAVIAAALWWWGRGRQWLAAAPAALAASGAILLVPAIAAPAAVTQGIAGSAPFSEQQLASLRSEGRPVFLYFTADWCLTCKVNEKAVLERSDVARAFEEKDVAVLVGDWSRGDAEIGRFLERHGRSGVPLYLYYAPGKPAQILPQILTPARLAALSAP